MKQLGRKTVVGRLAAAFTLACPEVTLAVTTEDRTVDLLSEGCDLVIRVNPEPDSELVGRCFARDQVLLVSVPALREQFGGSANTNARPLPVVVRGAMRHTPTWSIPGPTAREIQTQAVLELPALTMVRDAVLTGIGAARLPRLIVADDLAAGRLVAWGPASDQPSELWELHTSRRLASAKVKAFMQFLETAFPTGWI